MKKLFATGYDLAIEDDRPQLYISSGAGNTAEDEIHFDFVDPFYGEHVRGWFNKTDLLAAIIAPDGEMTS